MSKELKNYHSSKFVQIDDNQVEIDKKLIPLVTELNKLGIKTIECCQGGQHHSSKTIHINRYITVDTTNLSLKTELNQLTIYWKK